MKNSKRINLFIIFIFSFILLSGSMAAKPGKYFLKFDELIGKTAPNFTLKTLEGKTLKLSSLKGKVIILDFWATWCPPCRAEIPSFIELQNQYKKKGLVIIGIAMDDKAKVEKFAKSNGINYQIVIGDENVSLAYGGISGIPTTFVIGKDMKIKSMHVGYAEIEVFEKEILKLL